MYNDTIKVANKIITYESLFEIFSKMHEKLVELRKVYNVEEMQNRMLERSYQKWSFKDNSSRLSFDVNFYDDTNIKFDNYNNFIGIFSNRLHEIKSIHVYFKISYSTTLLNGREEYYHQYINMSIYETKADIDVSLSSEDKKIDDIYELIKNKILTAPEKYDFVIKKKSLITSTVGMAIGFIPALIISTLLLFVPLIRDIFVASYVLYPVCCIMIALFIGLTAGDYQLQKLYENIIPDKKYVGYDSTNYKSIYKDDIDKYIQTSEILIGKNVDNLKYRDEIMQSYNKYKMFIPIEIMIMIVFSVVTLLLGVI